MARAFAFTGPEWVEIFNCFNEADPHQTAFIDKLCDDLDDATIEGMGMPNDLLARITDEEWREIWLKVHIKVGELESGMYAEGDADVDDEWLEQMESILARMDDIKTEFKLDITQIPGEAMCVACRTMIKTDARARLCSLRNSINGETWEHEFCGEVLLISGAHKTIPLILYQGDIATARIKFREMERDHSTVRGSQIQLLIGGEIEEATPECYLCGKPTGSEWEPTPDEHEEISCRPCITKYTELALAGRQASMDAHGELWPAADVYSFLTANEDKDEEGYPVDTMPVWFRIAYET